jgi:hypothetical protein
MKTAQLVTLGVSLLCIGAVQAQTFAPPFRAPGIEVSGIRSNSTTTDDVVITAGFNSKTLTTACPQAGMAALYAGPLHTVAITPLTGWTCFLPNIPNITPGSSTFYGPNTSIFDTSLGDGNVRAVGTYQYKTNQNKTRLRGMMYTGPVTGCPNNSTSCWTPLDATPLLTGDQQLVDTVPHSTMGNLVVGNWNTKSGIGRAFIYDISSGTWLDINPTHTLSITAYGIWQNSDGTYTITGGCSDVRNLGVDEGYLADYDPTNTAQPFSHVTRYHFHNQPALVSHFDGISGNPDGSYSLAGEVQVNINTIGGFFTKVVRLPDGSLDPMPHWTPINYAFPGVREVRLTTGDTVIDNSVLGVFNGVILGTGRTTRSYIASVP